MEMYVGSKDKIVELLKNGKSVEEVASATGLSENLISDILEDLLAEEIFSPFETVNS